MVHPKKRAQRTLHELLEQTENWDPAVFVRYQRSTWAPDTITEDDAVQADIEFAEILKTILLFFTESTHAQEQWEFPGWHPDTFGCTLYAEAKKQGHTYRFGIDEHGFFIETTLHSPLTIKFMSMEFWRRLIELDALGKLTLADLQTPTIPPENKAYRHLLTQGKAVLYQLIRNLVLIEAEGPDPEDSRVSIDFATLRVAWRDKDTSWEDLLQKGALAFQHLYQMNYLLYRHRYLSEHALLARIRRHRNPPAE
ncbi:MAG: hypothetical protein ACE141_19025 [Bryobacteraceae bacterium]